jgi:hypothetical protein
MLCLSTQRTALPSIGLFIRKSRSILSQRLNEN